MRLVKLSVQRFQCIEEAELDFGPALNVLFGPNDLGKSSLAWAIRAVLLLQHNSSHHERFVSWYAGDQPRVSLTFTDAEGRYWRVTKTFGGSAGRSLLEASKDGRSFSADANGRQVDEKLRKLLGWGLAAPGGTGGGRGFPDSFLAQVLLSEQDNVRKVLFDTSLTTDADESGRRRLTEALGALAQDPLFKQVLDEAQEYVDRAFTKTGRKKRAAGSPFVETTERIKSMQRELESLDGKVRDTESAERRIAELVQQRDVIARDLEAAAKEQLRLEAALAVASRRAELRGQITSHEERLKAAEALRTEIASGEREHGELHERIRKGTQRIAELTALVTGQNVALEKARAEQELLLLDTDGARARAVLEDQLVAQRAKTQDTLHHVQRCREREAAARAAADALAEVMRDVQKRAVDAATAEEAQNTATERHERATASLEQAKRRLRDATSSDQAQARELQRKELENQRLSLAAVQKAALDTQQQLGNLREQEARVDEVRRLHQSRSEQVADASKAVRASEQALVEQDTSEQALLLLQAFAELQTSQAALAAADSAAKQADDDRLRIASLRREAAQMRANLRADLPSSARAMELRRLAEDVRVAEARLGGGLSIVLRPRREVRIQATLDDRSPTQQHVAAVTAFSAQRSAALQVDDLIDIEVTAGEEDARQAARDLKQRWAVEGEALLNSLGVGTLDELDAAIAAAESVRRSADEHEREASSVEQRLAERAQGDMRGLAARIEELEASLGKADRGSLSAQLENLGEAWSKHVKQGLASVGTERTKLSKALETQRAQLARLEAQRDNDAQTVASLREDLERKLAELGGLPADIEKRTAEQLLAIGRELDAIDAQLAALVSVAGEVETLRADVTAAEKSVADAKQAADQTAQSARHVRDALVQTQARRDAAVQRAREIDVDAVWQEALQSGGALAIDPWAEATLKAEQAHTESKRQCERLQTSLEELAKTKAEAVQAARDAVRTAEHRATQSQGELSSARDANHQLEKDAAAKLLAIAEMKTRLATMSAESARAEIEKLRRELAAIPGDDGVDEAALERQRTTTIQLRAAHVECVEDLARARGALEQVGGSIVREQKRELEEAIKRESQREREIEIEFDAWKLLVDTMRDTESKAGAHLGRALAGPVSQRFRQLTGGRYGTLELGAHLEGAGLHVAGQTRELAALSAGTQDQLATLLRLCIAEQLRTGIILDDHLSQSDPRRVSWFNSILRAAAHKIQIVFITCRPGELLTEAELPAPTDAMRVSAADHLRAIDLTKVVRRFAPDAPPTNAVAAAQRVIDPKASNLPYDS